MSRRKHCSLHYCGTWNRRFLSALSCARFPDGADVRLAVWAKIFEVTNPMRIHIQLPAKIILTFFYTAFDGPN